jgi:DNA-binding Lrp family transcriptional regulator
MPSSSRVGRIPSSGSRHQSEFEEELARVAAVRSAERLFGDPYYLLRVVTADLVANQVLRDEQLATLPGVHRLSSTIVMKRIVDERPLPLY